PLHARQVPPHLRLITRHALLTYGHKHWLPWQVRLLAGVIRLEAWLRQGLAWKRGEDSTAALYHQPGRLAGGKAPRGPIPAARRLGGVGQREEAAYAAAHVRRHPQP